MRVDLNPDQRELLLRLLDGAIRDLGPEIRHTDDSGLKDDLREQRRDLWHVRELLAPGDLTAPDVAGADLVGTP